MHLQGSKSILNTSREISPFCTPAGKEDPVATQQVKTLFAPAGQDYQLSSSPVQGW